MIILAENCFYTLTIKHCIICQKNLPVCDELCVFEIVLVEFFVFFF